MLSCCPRGLSKHLGTIYNRSRGLPRSSSLVFFLLSPSFSVSGGFAGDSPRLLSGPSSIFAAGIFTTSLHARGLSWLSWGPLVLSQYLGNVYDCSPGLPRSSPLVFLPVPSSLMVSPGFSGVPGYLASTWGHSTIAPWARRDHRRLFFYELLPCCGLSWLS